MFGRIYYFWFQISDFWLLIQFPRIGRIVFAVSRYSGFTEFREIEITPVANRRSRMTGCRDFRMTGCRDIGISWWRDVGISGCRKPLSLKLTSLSHFADFNAFLNNRQPNLKGTERCILTIRKKRLPLQPLTMCMSFQPFYTIHTFSRVDFHGNVNV